MKKQPMLLAWCVELEKTVTPYEALGLQINQLKGDLTFQCLECKRALIFSQYGREFLNHPLFKSRSRENHTHCLKAIYRSHLTEEVRLWVDTVEALTLMATTTRRLKKVLYTLDITQTYFCEEFNPRGENKDRFSQMLTIDLTPAKEAYKVLETTLLDLKKEYQEGWMCG